MKVEILDTKGKKLEEIILPESLSNSVTNPSVISQYIYMYLSNQRQGNAHTKDRSEVRGGGKKPWKQKGTGRARFGSSRNPIWRGGGIAFGPTNSVNWRKKITPKFKKAAFRNIFSEALKGDKILCVDQVQVNGDKLTSSASEIIKNLGVHSKKVTFITLEPNIKTVQAFSNIPNAKVTFRGQMNPFDIYAGGKIVFEKDALLDLIDFLK